jgi:hypothetical protein
MSPWCDAPAWADAIWLPPKETTPPLTMKFSVLMLWPSPTELGPPHLLIDAIDLHEEDLHVLFYGGRQLSWFMTII